MEDIQLLTGVPTVPVPTHPMRGRAVAAALSLCLAALLTMAGTGVARAADCTVNLLNLCVSVPLLGPSPSPSPAAGSVPAPVGPVPTAGGLPSIASVPNVPALGPKFSPPAIPNAVQPQLPAVNSPTSGPAPAPPPPVAAPASVVAPVTAPVRPGDGALLPAVVGPKVPAAIVTPAPGSSGVVTDAGASALPSPAPVAQVGAVSGFNFGHAPFLWPGLIVLDMLALLGVVAVVRRTLRRGLT
ncbi:MAG: hypothetical protein ACR2GX_02260 [Candidatus Dormibacteria bacterium]